MLYPPGNPLREIEVEVLVLGSVDVTTYDAADIATLVATKAYYVTDGRLQRDEWGYP